MEKQGEGKPSQSGRTRRMCRKTTVCPAGGVKRRDPCLGKFEKALLKRGPLSKARRSSGREGAKACHAEAWTESQRHEQGGIWKISQ